MKIVRFSATVSTKAYESFLQDRLELNPERRELRLELVKVRYSLGMDADASQDFQAVVAGLSSEESSQEILDLQRYLRSIDRKDAATLYLAQYLKVSPERLDVARELIEIYLSGDRRADAEKLVASLDAAGAAPENVVELVEYLLSVEMFSGARFTLVERPARLRMTLFSGLFDSRDGRIRRSRDGSSEDF